MSRDWRPDVAATSGLTFILGLWLVLTPVVLDYGPGDAAWNPFVCGALVALLALSQTLGRAIPRWPSAAIMAVAAWFYISGFWLAESALASWNSWSAGALIFFLATVGLAARVGRRTA